ncbi:MAG: COG1361 S-layer family protein [Euryarchaeota archaeon]|nr:COG1361 S-layer family protein [Euryarchaeota archaeon]
MRKQQCRTLRSALTVLVLLAILTALAAPAEALSVKLMKYDPYPANTGEYVTVWIKIENPGLGGPSEDVKLRIVPEYPFSLEPGEIGVEEIGKLSMNDYAMFDFRLRVDDNAIDGKNILKVEYMERIDSEWSETELIIEVESDKVDFEIADIDSVPLRLKPGDDDAKIVVMIQNIGDGDAECAKTRIILPRGFNASDSYSDIANLGTVAADASSDATFHIDVDESVQPGDQIATIIISYMDKDSDEYKEETLDLRIPIKKTPLFEIASSEITPGTITVGDTVTLKMQIENTGSEEGESVRARAMLKSEQPFDFSNGEAFDYVGDLDVGEIGEAVLKFNVGDDATLKTYLLDIEIRCVEDEDVHLFDRKVPVAVANTKPSNLIPIFIGGAVLVLLYLGYRFLLPKIRK